MCNFVNKVLVLSVFFGAAIASDLNNRADSKDELVDTFQMMSLMAELGVLQDMSKELDLKPEEEMTFNYLYCQQLAEIINEENAQK